MMNSRLFRVVTLCVLGIVAEAGAAPAPSTPLETRLHVALQRADLPAVRELVKAGADVNARDLRGGNALHVAVNFAGDLDVMTLLLDRGVDLHATNEDGQTPLMVALQHAHYRHEGNGDRLVQVARLLIARGASVKVAGAGGRVPLRAAMDPFNLPLIELLLKHGAALPDDGLDWALSNANTPLIRLLMPRATPAMLAWTGPTGGTLLHRAAESPETAFVIPWLLSKGLDVNAPDHERTTPLGQAALSGNLAGVVALHKAQARLDGLDDDGQSALHLAAYGAHHDVLQWLVQRHLDVKARDKRGRSSLDIALDTQAFAFFTDARKLDVIALLGGVPGDVQRGRFGNHPLHVAVRQRDLATVERLLEAGASPNLKDASGNTPLYWAIVESSPVLTTPAQQAWGRKLLPLLIRHGADTRMKPGRELDRTYDQLAQEMRVADLLERAKRRQAPR